MRRGFTVGAAGLLEPLAGTEEVSDSPKPGMGISDLRLQTSKVNELESFYRDVIGMQTHRNSGNLIVEAGATRITFEAVSDREPFYHMAFNIPENKLDMARHWQKQRTDLIRRGKSEVIHFSHWNARSIFFRDPAGNLLEYIARHDIENAVGGEFSSADILYASEIGLVVDDVAKIVAAAKKDLNLGIYRDNGANFASIGDEHALLVVVKRDRKWFPARERSAKVFPLSATIRKPKARSLVMSEYSYRVSTN